MSYANYLYIAIRAAVDAGKSIMDIYNDPESDFGIERKADNSPLTKADKAAHRLITNALSVTPFPVLSEEGKEIPFKERSKWETLWIVDPLDGTNSCCQLISLSIDPKSCFLIAFYRSDIPCKIGRAHV